MADPREVLLPNGRALTDEQVRLSRYGNVKIELLGVALARVQAQKIIDEHAAAFPPPAPLATKQIKEDDPQQSFLDDEDDDTPTP